MPESTFFAPDETATEHFAARLAAKSKKGDVLLLSGPLGAGKTSFARAFIRAVAKNPALQIPSPSFTLLQSYETASATIFHYDLWRLTGPEALEELGWDEAQEGIVLVEWPDRLGVLTPPQALAISLSLRLPGREITISGEQRWFNAS